MNDKNIYSQSESILLWRAGAFKATDKTAAGTYNKQNNIVQLVWMLIFILFNLIRSWFGYSSPLSHSNLFETNICASISLSEGKSTQNEKSVII